MLVSDGAFNELGELMSLPAPTAKDMDGIEKLFRHRVLSMLMDKGHLDTGTVKQMMINEAVSCPASIHVPRLQEVIGDLIPATITLMVQAPSHQRQRSSAGRRLRCTVSLHSR